MAKSSTSDLTILVIRVRQYGPSSFTASTPNQGFYRSASSEKSFEDAVEELLARHFPGRLADVRQIPHNSAAVSALGVKPDRNDADAIETRWFTAEVEIAD